MDKFANTMKDGIIAIFFFGIIGYFIVLVVYVFAAIGFDLNFLGINSNEVKLFINVDRIYMLGLPIAAAAAFAIVCILEKSTTNTDGGQRSENLSFKAFGLEFSGPAAPATIWIACYLTIVCSMKLVQH